MSSSLQAGTFFGTNTGILFNIHLISEVLVTSNPTVLALNVCTLTVIFLTVHLLVLRSTKHQAYLLLALCLFSTGFIIAKPFVSIFSPNLQLSWLLFSLPTLLVIAPSFWLYVIGITHDSPWRLNRADLKHFYLAVLGLFIVITAMLLPKEVLQSVVLDDVSTTGLLQKYPKILSYWIEFSLITTFVLVLTFVLQSGYYCFLIFKRLNHYNRHLKDLFASTETRELRWMSTLLSTIGVVWLMTALNLVWNNFFHVYLINKVWIYLIILIMIWSISIWGLRQKPGFEEVYETSKNTQNDELATDEFTQKKYERSALDQRQSQAIAGVIVDAMQKDQLYLDNELSLQKLSKHINTPANYISQTLNATIGMNFFDFVNKYRIEQAKLRLANSSLAVLDIAFEVGFNAKSSFYKAFKKTTTMTPTDYRKQHRLKKRNGGESH